MNGSKISKNVAYVLAPIFALLLILSTLGTKIIDEEINVIQNSNYIWQMAGGLANVTKGVTPLLIPISVMILIILAVVVIDGIGKNKNEDTIKLNWFDEWKLEVVLALSFILFIAGVYILSIGWNSFENSISIMLSSCGIGIIYVNSIVLLETIVKRIKARMLWKTTLIYAIYKAIKKMIDNRKIMTKLFIYYWGFCIIGFFITLAIPNSTSNKNLFQVVMLAALGITTFYVLCKKVEELNKIQMALKSIYDGDTNIELNPNELKGVLKQMAVYIDDIAGGLSNAIEQSLKSERLKTELITNVSHDIKTPLTSIIIMLDNIIDNPSMDDKTKLDFINDIKRESLNINFLVQAILKLSKFDVNVIKFDNKDNDLNKIVKETVKNVSSICDLKNVLIEVSYCDKAIINFDYKWQIEAISNVLKNAIEHSKEFSTVKIKLENNKLYAKVSIIDNGVGIDKEDLKHIFERFYKGKNSSKDSVGIGLALAKSIIEASNGLIDVKSKKDEGTIFEIKYFK